MADGNQGAIRDATSDPLAVQVATLRAEFYAFAKLMDERAVAIDRALTLQAAETERRLDALNGEASRLAKVLSESVPREVWQQTRDSDQKALEVAVREAGTYITREAFQSRTVAVDNAFVALGDRLNLQTNRVTLLEATMAALGKDVTAVSNNQTWLGRGMVGVIFVVIGAMAIAIIQRGIL